MGMREWFSCVRVFLVAVSCLAVLVSASLFADPGGNGPQPGETPGNSGNANPNGSPPGQGGPPPGNSADHNPYGTPPGQRTGQA